MNASPISSASLFAVVLSLFLPAAGALINVSAGTLVGGNYAQDTWTSNQASLNVAPGATFAGDEANVIIAALSGSGTVLTGYNGSGYSTFTLGVGGASGSFSGIIANDQYTGNLTKIGSGTQVLSGSNTYTGVTTVSGGRLQIGNGGTTGSIGSTSSVSVASLAVLAFARSDSYGGSFTPAISGSGGILLSSGTLTLTGDNTYSGATYVDSGTLIAAADDAIPEGTSLTIGAGASTAFTLPVAESRVAGVVAVPEPGTWVLLLVALWSAIIYGRFARRTMSRVRRAQIN